MPIHIGAANIEIVALGKVSIVSGYVGADKVYGYEATQILTLTNATDFDLKTFIDASGALYTKPIIINMASNIIIGGVNTNAFTIAGLPTHQTITINVNGEIQGAQGGNAIASDEPFDIISTGTISGAIVDGLEVDDSLITMVVSSTGGILAGGGNGGNGGKGADGEQLGNKETRAFSYKSYQYGFGGGTDNPDYGVYWSSYKGIGSGTGLKASGYWYGAQDYAQTPSLYSPRRYAISAAYGGAGGAGGLGAGYNQPQTDGDDGGNADPQAGVGGKGGNGGNWGVDGETGGKGGSAIYYTTYTQEVRAGANGIAGTSAGMAVVSTGALRIYLANSPEARALNL